MLAPTLALTLTRTLIPNLNLNPNLNPNPNPNPILTNSNQVGPHIRGGARQDARRVHREVQADRGAAQGEAHGGGGGGRRIRGSDGGGARLKPLRAGCGIAYRNCRWLYYTQEDASAMYGYERSRLSRVAAVIYTFRDLHYTVSYPLKVL